MGDFYAEVETATFMFGPPCQLRPRTSAIWRGFAYFVSPLSLALA